METITKDASLHEIIARYADVPGGLLPLLHALQDEVGHVPPAVVPDIARALNLSRAEVHGVISFYHEFRQQPAGRHVVQVCRAEACQSVGGRDLERHARDRLGVDFGETTGDGAVTLEPVYCLGNCACGPSVRVGDRVHARMTPDRFDQLLGKLGVEAGQ